MICERECIHDPKTLTNDFECEALIAKNVAIYVAEIIKTEALLDELEFDTSAKATRKRKRLRQCLISMRR